LTLGATKYIVARYSILYPTPEVSMSVHDPLDHLPLTETVFQILLSVADGERHGYGIIQEVEERTRGRVRLGPGTLYGAIKRLRESRLIEEVEVDDASCEDERRRYYHLTSFGRAVALAEARRIEELIEAAHRKRLLSPAGSA
jgi:DNA-binding PadR family transcriptional regulator